MRAKNQVEHRERGRAAMRALSQRARFGTWMQEKYCTEREAIISGLPEFPRSIRELVREHGDGYHRAVVDQHIVGMYLFDGALYRLTDEKRPELARFPTWEVVARDELPNLGQCRLYWVNGGAPVLYFGGPTP
jgi:hypothetical protein